MGETSIMGVCFLPIFVHLDIEIFGNVTYLISSTLSITSQKPYIQEKSGSYWIVWARPLVFRLRCFFGIFCVFSHNFSSNAVV